MVARVLAIPGEDKLIPIRITNLTVLPITLYKGQTIGKFCPFLLPVLLRQPKSMLIIHPSNPH